MTLKTGSMTITKSLIQKKDIMVIYVHCADNRSQEVGCTHNGTTNQKD